MLSRTGEYALRSVLYIAQYGENRPMPANIVADALKLPRNYLSKTLNRLAKLGVLTSERGPKGGFQLAKPADALRITEVVGDFASMPGPSQCLLGGRPCDPRQACQAHGEWMDWTNAVTRLMDGKTIADLLGDDAPARKRAAAASTNGFETFRYGQTEERGLALAMRE